MSKIRIRNYNELLLEQERLEHQLSVQQQVLRHRVEQMKEKLAPASRLISWIGNLKKVTNNPLLKTGLKIGTDVLLKKMVFRKTNWIVSLASSFLIRNVAAGIASGKAAGLVTRAIQAIDRKIENKKLRKGSPPSGTSRS